VKKSSERSRYIRIYSRVGAIEKKKGGPVGGGQKGKGCHKGRRTWGEARGTMPNRSRGGKKHSGRGRADEIREKRGGDAGRWGKD